MLYPDREYDIMGMLSFSEWVRSFNTYLCAAHEIIIVYLISPIETPLSDPKVFTNIIFSDCFFLLDSKWLLFSVYKTSNTN